MLNEDLCADAHQNDAAEYLGLTAQPAAEFFAQQMARKAADERDAGDEGSRRGDVHIQRGKADADSQRIDAGGEGLHHHQLIAERAAHRARLRRAQLLDGVPDHFAADEAQQCKGDPVVKRAHHIGEGAARKIPGHGHQALKHAEGQRREGGLVPPQAGKTHAVGDGHRKCVHRKPQREYEQGDRIHNAFSSKSAFIRICVSAAG